MLLMEKQFFHWYCYWNNRRANLLLLTNSTIKEKKSPLDSLDAEKPEMSEDTPRIINSSPSNIITEQQKQNEESFQRMKKSKKNIRF